MAKERFVMAEKRLYRSCKDRILGGVAGGVAEYFDFDPAVTRLVFALIMITTGFGFLAYLVAWLVIPQDPSCTTKQSGVDEIKDHAEKVADDIRKAAEGTRMRQGDVAMWVGLTVLVLGLLFLAQSILGSFVFKFFWPLWLILIGLILLVNSFKRK